MSLLTRKELLDRLTNNVVDLYFTKVNGQNRKMRATLNPQLIPGSPRVDDSLYEGSQTYGVISVYDLDKSDWRAFKIENVHATITPALGEVRSDGQIRID